MAQRCPNRRWRVWWWLGAVVVSNKSRTVSAFLTSGRPPLQASTGKEGQRIGPICDARLAALPSSLIAGADVNDIDEEGKEILRVLEKYGYAKADRIIQLRNGSLRDRPVLAELYEDGGWKPCWIHRFFWNDPKTAADPPKVEVSSVLEGDAVHVVDLGQVTTVWIDDGSLTACNESLPADCWDAVQKSLTHFPVHHVETCLQSLYNHHVHHRVGGGSNSQQLSKKQIAQLARPQSRMEDVLRKMLKAGPRLVDSQQLALALHGDGESAGSRHQQRMVAAECLARDAQQGGRFKRFPTLFVGRGSHDRVTLLNGGWIVLDTSVRAASEARKLAQRVVAATHSDETSNDTRETTTGPAPENSEVATTFLLTAADLRIAQRLECLAMGDTVRGTKLKKKPRGTGEDDNGNSERDEREDERLLELDVREVLKSMQLPITPEGAREALLRMGRWSQQEGGRTAPTPFPEHVRRAAQDLSDSLRLQRQRLGTLAAHRSKGGAPLVDGRLDLTNLPSVCIDAKRTSFRDDAIAVRPRSVTGRPVRDEASRWEILIHIADVSILHSPDQKDSDKSWDLLREAAASRGVSRYDLPLGPLHLLPPVALDALSLQVQKIGGKQSSSSSSKSTDSVNICVTVWAYIDERDGSLIDCGVERSLIAPPVALTYATATALLDGSDEELNTMIQDEHHSVVAAKSIMAVAERNLVLWAKQRHDTNDAAKRRESRLAAKELVARVERGADNNDDSRSFQRSRGHRIVDAALDLYGHVLTQLLSRSRAPIPRAPGAGADRAARLGTAPLRRYMDGVGQRQALAALCDYGGPPLTREECRDASRTVQRARDVIAGVRSTVKGATVRVDYRRVEKLRTLQAHLLRLYGDNDEGSTLPATSTGKENEVTILGNGATAQCRGVKGTLKPGEQVMVRVISLEPERGVFKVRLVPTEEVV